MAVSVGGTILGSEYNALQGRIANILGTGSGQTGYGQTLASAQIDEPTSLGSGDGDTVEAVFMQNMFDDMNKAYTHQTGSDLSTILTRVTNNNVIGADNTGTGLTYSADRSSWTFDSQDTKGGFNDYLAAMTTIENQRFNIFLGNPTQGTATTATTDVRTTDWGSPGDISINMEFTATFTSVNHRRYFFNSGGEVRISGSLSNDGGSAKNIDWATMLTNMGIVKLNYTTTSASSGTAYAIGDDDLTSIYQTIYTKAGSGVYAENTITIEARNDSATVIRFKVTLRDADTGDQQPGNPPPAGPAEDEFVTGDITLALGSLRASGTNVSVNAPSIVKTANTLE